jgi:hypothetical protein
MDTCKWIAASLLALLIGCGPDQFSGPAVGNGSTEEINQINARITALSATAASLDAIINSDYATCPSSGDTADPLIRKICQVAQASTIELQVQLTNQMASYVNDLKDQITANQTDLANQQALIDAANTAVATNTGNIATLQSQITAANLQLSTINATLSNIQVDITTLQGRMTSAEAAIAALQSLTNSINGTLQGVMTLVSIGEENLTAGPVYEAILKSVDKKRFNGYVEAYGPQQTLGNNVITAVSGSATVTIALTSHGYAVGDILEFSQVTASRGFLTSDVNGPLTVVSVPNANSFTVTYPRVATSSGTLGGSIAYLRKVNGRGMATLWKSADVSDSAVRATSAGSKTYNFIIRRIASDVTNNTAELCYDKSNRSATFATINAAPTGGSGNILCK